MSEQETEQKRVESLLERLAISERDLRAMGDTLMLKKIEITRKSILAKARKSGIVVRNIAL